MAIGDVDSDGFSDLITVNDAQDHFQVHYYDPTVRSYSETSMKTYIEGAKIVSIVLSRNQELLQSLYVVYVKTGGSSTEPETYLKVFK